MNWEKLVEERNAWIMSNFPGDTIERSLLGCIEELGELAHCHLKEAQGIRGTAEEHQLGAQDAIGDLSIYLLGVMNVHGVPEVKPMTSSSSAEQTLLNLSYHVGKLAAIPSRWGVEQIVHLLHMYCRHREWNYHKIVEETWTKVKRRNWIADPETGGEGLLLDTPEPADA